MPIPIQSGSLTDRLRKFFRLRGKSGFSLDEVVAPVVLVQDLTQGPYQAGVTPAAGERRLVNQGIGTDWAFAIMLNDKVGSVTPVLGAQFDDRSFSFTNAEVQANGFDAADLADLRLNLTSRANVVAAGVPTEAVQLSSIQNNDGTKKVPVEIFVYDNAAIVAISRLSRFALGDNTNTLGSRRSFENLKPNITIGPKDVLTFSPAAAITVVGGSMFMSVRGFYQEQPG